MIEKFGIMRTIPNLTKTVDGNITTRLAQDGMRMALANKLTSLYVKETTQEFHTELRMDIVVATLDDYWKDVQETAMKMQQNLYRF